MDLKKLAKKAIGLLLTMENMLSYDPHLLCWDFLINHAAEVKLLREAFHKI